MVCILDCYVAALFVSLICYLLVFGLGCYVAFVFCFGAYCCLDWLIVFVLLYFCLICLGVYWLLSLFIACWLVCFCVVCL